MDCGGAAAMLATFSSAVRAGATQRLHLVCCLAENAIGPGALRNDDIITLYSGKTVEINNTDAEGRLVLGDGVAYATKHLSPHLVIDMATLTGAQLVATGKRHAAVVSNRDDLEAAAIAAGRASGDLVAPLPFAPEFFRAEFKSTVRRPAEPRVHAAEPHARARPARPLRAAGGGHAQQREGPVERAVELRGDLRGGAPGRGLRGRLAARGHRGPGVGGQPRHGLRRRAPARASAAARARGHVLA